MTRRTDSQFLITTYYGRRGLYAPDPLIIPCHRVIRNDNVPGGYILGKNRKKVLLNLEKMISKCLANKE
ncbi:MAG: MGMT family protein [Candidatus Omnitrophica bacterium]|nr:MGMT family protein [Candidatus Omnitrophota bacterium]